MRRHFGASSAMKSAKSFGEPTRGATPSRCMAARVSGRSSTRLVVPFNVSTMAWGVPAGAHGGVDDQAGGHGPEQFDDLVDHHRPVLEPLAHLQPPDRAGTVGMSPRSM